MSRHSFKVQFSFYGTLYTKQDAIRLLNFFFAEEGNSSSQNIQYVFLASVNFLFLFTKI